MGEHRHKWSVWEDIPKCLECGISKRKWYAQLEDKDIPEPYQTPWGDWACLAAGIVADGFASREDAIAWAQDVVTLPMVEKGEKSDIMPTLR